MFTIIIGWLLINGFIGCVVGHCRGTGAGKGLFLGMMFGPLGWILMMFEAGPAIGFVLCFVSLISSFFIGAQMMKESAADERKEQARQAAERQAEVERMREEPHYPGFATPQPYAPPTPTPRPYVIYHPPVTPTAQQTAAEIARKYGGR